MKKELPPKEPQHPTLTEEKNSKEMHTPGRSGGTYDLSNGSKLTVPEGLFGKKDHVTCTVVPPNQRWRYTPSFPGEHLTSEIVSLSGNATIKQQTSVDSSGAGSVDSSKEDSKKTLMLTIPYYKPSNKQQELNVKGMWKDECTWVDVGFIHKHEDSDTPCVELQLDRLGTFAVTFRAKTDQFSMTPNGGLFHSRLNRNLTIRFPKKAVDTAINYNMLIEPIPEDRVAFCREFFPQDCADLLVASEFIDFGPDVHCNFRRVATIKLPLPLGVEVEGESSEEIVVLHKESGRWEWVDSKYKFSRTNVTFDVKNPTR